MPEKLIKVTQNYLSDGLATVYLEVKRSYERRKLVIIVLDNNDNELDRETEDLPSRPSLGM